MRKETSNQFTEGLVSDLNPINTPNTVLTDALNATIITYDGNEYSLQNDRGNYPLENCRLKPNYIPVGIKEYSDILYIVSYNPITEHVEIGTYPSPLNVESSKNNDTNLELESVIGNINVSKKYSELIEDCKLHIWTSDNEEDSKLYPGDSYKIEEQNISPYKYEALEYFIIDENRQKHNINNLIEKDGEWHPVAWQVPGWLATQYRIGTFDDFIMSVQSIEAPTFGENRTFDCNVHLNFQFRISDYLFLPQTINNQIINESEIKSDLGIRLTFSDKSSVKDISLKDASFLNWYSDSKILWMNSSSNPENEIILKNVEFGDTITITATPFVKITVDGVTKEIIYDRFEEAYTIYFNSIGSYSDFTIGDEIWKFYVDEDDDSNLYIEYNVSGPNITNKSVQLYYRILDLNGETVIKSWSEVSNYMGITSQGIGLLKFEDSFEKEAIYIIEFAFYEVGKDLNKVSNLYTVKKLVIASKIFSDFVGDYSNFNDIDFDIWINKYKDSITVGNWNVTHSPKNVDKNNIYQNYYWENNELKDINKRPAFTSPSLSKLWNNLPIQDKGLFSSEETEILKNDSIEFVAGCRGTEQLTISHDAKPLIGKLWENTPKIKIHINPYVKESYVKPKEWTREQILNQDSLKETVDVVYGKRKTFSYEISSEEFPQIKGLQEIKRIPLMWLYNWMDWTNLNDKSHSHLRTGGVLNMNSVDPPSKPHLTETIINISRDNVTIPNNITRSILSALGDDDFGILGVLMDEGERKFKLIQGSNTLFESKKNSQQVLYTYLVCRQNDKNNNYAILIPFAKDSGFWNQLLSTDSDGVSDWWHPKAQTFLSSLHDYMRQFTHNLQISTLEKALSNNFLVKIKDDNIITDVPVCEFEIKTDSFDKWNYKGFDLLNFEIRNSLFQKLGENVCGKLLSGSTTKIPEISFFSSIIKNTNSEISEDAFKEINKNVNTINSYIKKPEQTNGILLSQMQKRNNTKGIYWLGDSESLLTSILNRSYSNSNVDQIMINSTNIVKLYTSVGDEENKLDLGWVENEALVNI